MIKYVEMAPPLPLADVVHRIWVLRGTDAGAAPEPVVPDGHAELIVHLGEPFCELDDEGTAHRQASVLATGQLTGPIRLAPSAEADMIGIRFQPGGLSALLGVDMHELTDRLVPLADMRPRFANAIEDAARGYEDSAGRVRAVATALLSARRRRSCSTMVAQAVILLGDSALRIRDIARLLGTTPRTLERHFLCEVGVSPKVYQAVIRFRRAFGLLDRIPCGQWARVAAECGYFDQAHMVREFRRFAGASPTTFLQSRPQLATAFMGTTGDRDD